MRSRILGSTTSRAVLFSGTAFVLAMVGMVLVPDTILRSLAAGAILVGIVTVVAALTLLPAVLSLLGDRVNALRIPWLGRRIEASAGAEGRVWSRVVRFVTRAPVLATALSAGALLLVAVPVLGIETGPHRGSRSPRPVRRETGVLAARGGVRSRNRRHRRDRRPRQRDSRERGVTARASGSPSLLGNDPTYLQSGGHDEPGRRGRGRRGPHRGRQPRRAGAAVRGASPGGGVPGGRSQASTPTCSSPVRRLR